MKMTVDNGENAEQASGEEDGGPWVSLTGKVGAGVRRGDLLGAKWKQLLPHGGLGPGWPGPESGLCTELAVGAWASASRSDLQRKLVFTAPSCVH